MQHKCDFCQRQFDTATQPSFGVRESNRRRRIRELECKNKEELMIALLEIFEKIHVPKHMELRERTRKTCVGCEDDRLVLISINGLLMINAAQNNPLNPQAAIETMFDEIIQRIPSPTYDLH